MVFMVGMLVGLHVGAIGTVLALVYFWDKQ